MKQLNYIVFALMALLLSACASMTVPETPKQVVAASYITVESIADTAYLAHRDGVINDKQREDIRVSLQEALEYIRLSEDAIRMGEDPEVELETAQKILTNVQKLLQQRIEQHE